MEFVQKIEFPTISEASVLHFLYSCNKAYMDSHKQNKDTYE